MKRRLLTQMRHEWRGNLWMIIQLVIVSVILWYLFIGLWAPVNMMMQRKGYDVSDLYIGSIKVIDESSELYTPYDSLHSKLTDFDMLMSKIRSCPDIELAAAGDNVAMYMLNNYGRSISCDSLEYGGNTRVVTPDVLRIYRLQSPDGRSTEQLAEVIARGDLIISYPDLDVRGYNNPEPFLNRDVIMSRDSSDVYHVGAIAYGLPRFDYEPQWGTIYYPMPEGYVPRQLLIRIYPGHARGFAGSFTPDLRSAGNLYISGLQPVSVYRDEAQLSDNLNMRNYVICAVFLLSVIFLGFLGTFWFRTQQRADEMAVRIVSGATRGDIFRRFIGEGLILLVIATLIALPVDYMIVRNDLVRTYVQTYTYVTLDSVEIYQSFATTVILLVLLITAGIWLPARKAMKIDPAQSLKDL